MCVSPWRRSTRRILDIANQNKRHADHSSDRIVRSQHMPWSDPRFALLRALAPGCPTVC